MYYQLIKNCRVLGLLASSVLMVACAGTHVDENSEHAESSNVSSVEDSSMHVSAKQKVIKNKPNPSEPAQELTSDLLYELMLAEIALQRNDYDLAFDKYYSLAKQTRDARIAKKATRVTLFSKNDAQTFKAVKLWSEIQPNNIDVQQIYASALISEQKDEQAIVYMNKIISLSDNLEQGIKRVISIVDTIKVSTRAIQIYQKVTQNYQDKAVTLLYQAKVFYKFAYYEQAQQALEKALAKKMDYDEALVFKVALLKKQDKEEQAIPLLEKLIVKLPDNLGLQLELSRIYVKKKHYKKAMYRIEKLAEQNPSPEILFSMSLLAIEMEKIANAKTYLKRLYEHRLYSSEAAYFIGQLEMSEKNYSQAEEWFKHVTSGKYTFEAYLGLVMVYAQQKKFDQAFALLDHPSANDNLHKNKQQSVDVLQVKAELYVQIKDYQKAYKTYTQALELAPKNPDIRYSRAMLSEQMGHLDLLEKDLHKIIKDNPKDSQSLNALGYTLTEKTTRYQEALAYIENALKINPNDVAILDSMGWVLYKLERYSESLSYLKRAYDKDPDPEIAAHYGEVLWVSGNTQQAKIIWNKALKKDPKHDILLAIMTQYLGSNDAKNNLSGQKK